mgnify:FL=1
MRFYRPEIPLACLSSLAVPPWYSQSFAASAPQPISVVDTLPREPFDRFVEDNFGTARSALQRWPLPDQIADSVQSIVLASEEAQRDQRFIPRAVRDFVRDVVTLLAQMAERRSIFGLAQLSADLVERDDLRDPGRDYFKLIVGDTFADRVHFWNSRSRMPTYLGRDVCCLIVSPERLESQAFFDAIVAFLKARNSMQSSNQGPPRIELSSMSLSQDQLSALCERFRAADRWNGYSCHEPLDLDDDVPGDAVLRRAAVRPMGAWFSRAGSWREFEIRDREFRPVATPPKPLQGHLSKPSVRNGDYAVDLVIQRQGNGIRFTSEAQRWVLPKRLPIHGLFRSPYQDDPRRGVEYARTTRDGYLTLMGTMARELPPLSIPDESDAIRFGLEQSNNWPPLSRSDRADNPSGPYGWTRPSDKGRYLTGTLTRFESLANASAFLLHEYWCGVFNELGGSISMGPADELVGLIKRRFRGGEIASDEEWERLAGIVASEARKVRLPRRYIAFNRLQALLEPLLRAEADGLGGWEEADIEGRLQDARATLVPSVQWLCSREILHQGYEWRCERCYHNNWNAVDNLKTSMSCEICGAEEPVPVDRPWQFKMNGFIQEALREHGLLALVWCIRKLADRAREGFLYLGPHDLYADYPDNPRRRGDNEADLICIVDGLVHLCEVKSSARSIDVASLVAVAQRIRPDKAVLAVMGATSPGLDAKCAELQELLVDTGIAVELLTLDDRDFDSDAFLPG